MCRTDVLKTIDGYRIRGAGEDWDMLLRMAEVSRVANLRRILQAYRLHAHSATVLSAKIYNERYAHSCHCARLRANGKMEISFKAFMAKQRNKSVIWHACNTTDMYAKLQYRRALSEILGTHPATGWARLAWSGICYPPRSMHYFKRLFLRSCVSRSNGGRH